MSRRRLLTVSLLTSQLLAHFTSGGLVAEMEKLAVIVDQYESLQEEARSANDQVNGLTQRLTQNASR